MMIHKQMTYSCSSTVVNRLLPSRAARQCLRLNKTGILVPMMNACWYGSSSSSPKQDSNHDAHGSSNNDASTKKIPLVRVPLLPVLGSLVPQYSKTPPLDPSTFLQFYPEHRRRFGDFYTLGIPGVGKGLTGEIHVLCDPYEFSKIIRQNDYTKPSGDGDSSGGGSSHSGIIYPRGFIESEWPLIEYLQTHKRHQSLVQSKHPDLPQDAKGFYGRGPTWKRLRNFLQTDLLSPQAAKGYIPGMVQAAQIISDTMGSLATSGETIDYNTFINRCAFDLFSATMFGELTQTVDPTKAKSVNVEYCEKAILGFHTMTEIFFDTKELLQIRLFGQKTAKHQTMTSAFDDVFEMSHSKFVEFQTKNANNDLTHLEAQSYLANALGRQSSTDITDQEISDMIKVMLSAAIDTTSSVLGWNLYHVAIHPNVQERLYEELVAAMKELQVNTITPEVLQKSTMPYLHAIIRESHRLTPVIPTPIQKENSYEDIEIHGNTIPKDSLFFLDTYSLGIDPDYVGDNPLDFQPDRWSDEQVNLRKNSNAKLLDHPYYKAPFSEGSRKCPGSRVASYEVLVFLTQLVLDWKISLADPTITKFEDMKYSLTGIVTPELPQFVMERRQ